MKKICLRISTMFLVIILLLIGVGCTEQQSKQENSKPTTRIITDMAGRKVTIPAQVNRVSSTGGAVEEWILMLGSPEKLIATSKSTQANPWFNKVYPKIKDVATPFDGSGVNIEELIKARPDVVILLSGSNEIQDKIEKQGIPVVVLERRNPEELKQGITLAGKVLGAKEEKNAEAFCKYYDDNMKRVTAKTSSLPRDKKVKVYYAANGPLNTEGKNSIVTSWIDMAGGINVAAEGGVDGILKDVAMEDVMKWNPDVIIARDAPHKAAILKDERFKSINAVKNNQVYINPKGVYQWCVRSADEALQVLWAAKILHTDMFTDIDMNKEVKDFHKTYYNYELTDDEVQKILKAEPPKTI